MHVSITSVCFKGSRSSRLILFIRMKDEYMWRQTARHSIGHEHTVRDWTRHGDESVGVKITLTYGCGDQGADETSLLFHTATANNSLISRLLNLINHPASDVVCPQSVSNSSVSLKRCFWSLISLLFILFSYHSAAWWSSNNRSREEKQLRSTPGPYQGGRRLDLVWFSLKTLSYISIWQNIHLLFSFHPRQPADVKKGVCLLMCAEHGTASPTSRNIGTLQWNWCLVTHFRLYVLKTKTEKNFKKSVTWFKDLNIYPLTSNNWVVNFTLNPPVALIHNNTSYTQWTKTFLFHKSFSCLKYFLNSQRDLSICPNKIKFYFLLQFYYMNYLFQVF